MSSSYPPSPPLGLTKRQYRKYLKWGSIFLGTVGVIGVSGWAASRIYQVARATERFVVTGFGINGLRVQQRAFKIPIIRHVRTISIAPRQSSGPVDTPANNLIPIRTKYLATYMPDHEDPTQMAKFCRLYAESMVENGKDDLLARVVDGTVHNTTRVVFSSLDLMDLLKNRETHSKLMVNKINLELEPHGVKILNFGIESLGDTPGHDYFKQLETRALKTAEAMANVAIAEKERETVVAQKHHESEKRQEVAKLDAVATLAENKRKIEIAESSNALALKQIDLQRQQDVAQKEANAAIEKRNMEVSSHSVAHLLHFIPKLGPKRRRNCARPSRNGKEARTGADRRASQG